MVADGRDHRDPAAVSLLVSPQSTALRPLAPAHLKARRTSSGIVVSWIRRTRIDGDTWIGEVPIGEASEEYTLEILKGAEVVRSIATSTSSALYANADELSDFGEQQTDVKVRLAQMSAAVGRGFPIESILNIQERHD